jgi:hypothetical protein
MGDRESEGLTFDLITRTSVSLNKVGGEDAFQVGVLGEGRHIVGSIYRLLRVCVYVVKVHSSCDTVATLVDDGS